MRDVAVTGIQTWALPIIANMTVTEGGTADQVITGIDPDGDALTFTKAAGPAYMTVATTNATTGSIHLAPGISDAAAAGATGRASAGAVCDGETLTITITDEHGAPGQRAPSHKAVADGGSAGQGKRGDLRG